MKKARNAKAKVNLQPPFYVSKIDSKYPKSYCLLVKKDKKDANWEYRDETYKDKDKAKSYTPSSANQLQAQAFKKRQENQRGGLLANGVNAIEVIKKNKDKAKNLSYIECYTYKQKAYYASNWPAKPKNQWRSWRLPRQ